MNAPNVAETALITDDTVVLGLLAVALGLVFWTSSRPDGFWKKFYTYVPALLLCYFIPAIFNSTGLIDGNKSGLYPMARDYLLPAALETARMIAANSESAVRISKEVIDLATLDGDARAREASANKSLRGSEEQTARFKAATKRVTGRE